MLNFEPSMQGINTIDLTQEEAIVKFPPLRGNITPLQKDNYDGYDIIADNTSGVREELWTHVASAAPSGAGSTVPITVTSTSAQLPPPLDAEKVPFSPSSIKQVKNLVSKENTYITLASIGTDEVASCIDATTAQAFDVKMKKDSSDEESDGGDTDPDYGDDKRVSVLSDEEDEQTAKGDIVTPVTTEGGDAQATQTLIQVRLSVMTQLKPKKTRMMMMMIRNLQALDMALFQMVLQSLQQEESAKVHQTMC